MSGISSIFLFIVPVCDDIFENGLIWVCDDETVALPSGYAAIKIEAEMNVGGKNYKDVNYTILVPEEEKMQVADKRMFLVINDANEELVTNLKVSDIKVTGATIIHEESLSEGLLVLEAEDGAEVHITIGTNSYVLSKPACARVSIITNK